MSAERFRVVIVGGGVAALEGLLALRDLCGRGPEIELVAPESDFVYRPLAVAEPFGLGEPRQLELREIVADAGAAHRRDAVTEVVPDRRAVLTRSGGEIGYDALLLAFGAAAKPALANVLTYKGHADNQAIRDLLERLRSGELTRVAFAVPPSARWSVPLYELALLTAAWLAEHADGQRELSLITHEAAPLEMFGSKGSESVAELLAEAGIELRTRSAPSAFNQGQLSLAGGDAIDADVVVAMPRLEVAPLAGVPQGPHGFIGTDAYMRVEGLSSVWAAGDATWFPVKQGGIAAQQADVAAGSIAALIDPQYEPAPLRPVLRGALLTGSGPRYLRTEVGGRDETSAAGTAPLWWPPSKIAGRYLAPYLTGGEEEDPGLRPLADTEPAAGAELAESEADHRESLELALASADADARGGDYRSALRWLELVEELNLTVPPAYAEKRRRWRSEASGDARA